MSKVEVTPSCWEWKAWIHEDGYGIYQRKLAHRYAYSKVKGEIPEGLCVCHSCDNRRCVNPDHLWLGTRADNNADMVVKGREVHLSGNAHPRAKLRMEFVNSIKRLRAKGLTQQKIADKYGVSQSRISEVLLGKRWVQNG